MTRGGAGHLFVSDVLLLFTYSSMFIKSVNYRIVEPALQEVAVPENDMVGSAAHGWRVATFALRCASESPAWWGPLASRNGAEVGLGRELSAAWPAASPSAQRPRRGGVVFSFGVGNVPFPVSPFPVLPFPFPPFPFLVPFPVSPLSRFSTTLAAVTPASVGGGNRRRNRSTR